MHFKLVILTKLIYKNKITSHNLKITKLRNCLTKNYNMSKYIPQIKSFSEFYINVNKLFYY